MKSLKLSSSKLNSRNKVFVKSILIIALLFALIIIEIARSGSYLDEALGVVSVIYILFFRSKIEKYDLNTISILVFVIIIGIFSNIVSGLVNSIFSIGVDIIVETKLVFGFLFVKYFLSNREKEQIIDMLTPLAQLWCIVTTGLGLISQVVNTGMTDEIRLIFIKTFQFIFTFNHQYVSVYLLFFGIIICSKKLSENKKKNYIAIGLIGILLAAKSPSIIFVLVYFFLSTNFKNQKRINPFLVLIAGIAIIIVGWYQISSYLLEEGTPRRLFFEYGAKTANNYFPLGSGFSTFGSGEAANHYSPLYYKYGFDKMFGMTPEDTSFLNDTFWASCLGQFGWIGTILYFIVFVRIALVIRKKDYDYRKKAFIYAAFSQYMVHAIGAAILSSSAGMIGFMSLGLFISNDYDDNNDKKSKLKSVKLKLK